MLCSPLPRRVRWPPEVAAVAAHLPGSRPGGRIRPTVDHQLATGIHRPVTGVSTGRWCRSPLPADPSPSSARHPCGEDARQEQRAQDPSPGSTGPASRPPPSSSREGSCHEPGQGTHRAHNKVGRGQTPRHRPHRRLGLHRRGGDRRCAVLPVLAPPGRGSRTAATRRRRHMTNDIDSSPAPTGPAPIATFDGVTRRYGRVTAVDGLSLQIGSGETVALLGPNGAGKTSAVELLLGLAQPDAGVVRLFGGPPADAVAAGRVGAMLQDAGLPQGAKVMGLVRSLYPDPLSVADALGLADLEQVAGRQVERLSGGQRQRVRLALALAGNPELLILDEPTAALDVDARRSFWDRVRGYVAEGRAVLFATHRLEEADAVADRVVVIADGRLLADGTPDQVKAQAAGRSTISVAADGLSRYVLENLPAVETVRRDRGRVTLSTSNPDATIRALLQQAPHVQGLEVTQAGMEEAFRHLIHQGGTP